MAIEIIGLVVQGFTALAIVLGVYQLLTHSRQMHRDFESLYVERYWQVMDQRSRSWLLAGTPKPRDEAVIRRYLQLCEDEIDLRGLGRVTDATWGFWAEAIREQAGAEPYASRLAVLGADYPSVSRLMRDPAWDPCKWGWWGRRRRGL